MILMKQIITTKKGTTYERNGRDKKYDTMLWTRFNSEKAFQLKKIAEENNSSLSTFIRDILEDYLEKYKVEL